MSTIFQNHIYYSPISGGKQMEKQGRIVEATKKHFAKNAQTSDFDGTKIKSKEEMVKKMQSFAGAIAHVNGITLHNPSLNDKG